MCPQNQIHIEPQTNKTILLDMLNRGWCPPHLLILFIYHRILEWVPERLVKEKFNSNLQELTDEICKEFKKQKFKNAHIIEKLSEDLRNPLEQVVTSKRFLKQHRSLKNEKIGSTRLCDYYPYKNDDQIIKEINGQWNNISEFHLIHKVQKEDQQAFETLFNKYKDRLYGFIRYKCLNDQDADDIAQNVWIQIFEKIKTYNIAYSKFYNFLSFRAVYEILKFYKNNYVKLFVLFSRLMKRFPELEDEKELLDLLAKSQTIQTSFDHLTIKADIYEELLTITFRSNSPPHQIIVFGFSKLLEWKPQDIVRELSEEQLKNLAGKLEEDYLLITELASDVVKSCFQPLHRKMKQKLNEVLEDSKTAAIYASLLDRQIGMTRLAEYYTTKAPEENISQWWYAVVRRIKSQILRTSHLYRLFEDFFTK